MLNLPYTRENQSNLPVNFQFKPTDSLTYQHFFINTKKKIPLEVRKSLGQFIHQIAHTATVEKDFFSRFQHLFRQVYYLSPIKSEILQKQMRIFLENSV